MDKQITVNFSIKSIFLVFFSIVLIWLLFYLKDILVLFFLAFIFATAIKPAIDFFEKKRIPRWLSIVAIYSLVILGLYGLFRLIAPPITTQVQDLIENRQILAERFTEIFAKAPRSVKELITEFSGSLPERVSKYTSSSALGNVLGVFSGLLGALTVFVVSFYLLLDKGSLEDLIKDNWIGVSQGKAIRIYRKITQKVSLWMRGQLILSTAVGLLTFIGLTVLGVDFALTLALIAAVTELLPVVGPYIGAVPAILIAFTGAPILAFWVALLYFGIQQFEAQILVPQVMKRTLGLSPVAVIFALLVGAKLMGIIGVIVSVPVASAVAVLIEELKKREG